MRHTTEPSQNCNHKPLPNVKIPQILTFLFNIYISLIIKGVKCHLHRLHPEGSEFQPCKTLTFHLLKPTGEGFGKALIGLWVNFGRYLVPIKQRVEVGQKWAKMRPEMLKFNICFFKKGGVKKEVKVIV